ncbi:MAG: DUF1679 domain-containing protein [Psychromonas sp.]|nr:DUF1679 domain-containing protein [Alteromonadales bacterium]MCP5079286.1 DUF1679 domain-containing protein [Psychromonas sp.]
MVLSPQLEDKILVTTNSERVTDSKLIQGVWGGYGQLIRVFLSAGDVNSVVVKMVNKPKPSTHPKGWNSDISHQRKLFSYEVESYWYSHYADLHQSTSCYLPRCLFTDITETQHCFVLEDLSQSGFPIVKESCSITEAKTCLSWLAEFHALHLQREPLGLWPTGSYWHLETRPDELEKLIDSPLKIAAPKIDKILRECPFQTLIHGDAKLANFCFSESGDHVAGLDFQYVGQGCAMKDVILFISSAVKPEHCQQDAPLLVDHYFKQLKIALKNSEFDFQEIESHWRPYYSIAWADFHRFVKGWSPDHWKINSYTENLTQLALGKLDDFI